MDRDTALALLIELIMTKAIVLKTVDGLICVLKVIIDQQIILSNITELNTA